MSQAWNVTVWRSSQRDWVPGCRLRFWSRHGNSVDTPAQISYSAVVTVHDNLGLASVVYCIPILEYRPTTMQQPCGQVNLRPTAKAPCICRSSFSPFKTAIQQGRSLSAICQAKGQSYHVEVKFLWNTLSTPIYWAAPISEGWKTLSSADCKEWHLCWILFKILQHCSENCFKALFSQHLPQMPLIQVSVNDDEDIEGVYKRFRNSCNLAGMVYEVRAVYSIPSFQIYHSSLA